MNRADPWDWSSPFKLDQGMQALSAQINPLGNQNNMQAPPPVAPYSSPIQQALSNKAVNAGMEKVFPTKSVNTTAKPEVPVVDSVTPTYPTQIGAPVGGVPEAGNQLAAAGGGSELLASGAEAQALLEAQLAAAAAADV